MRHSQDSRVAGLIIYLACVMVILGFVSRVVQADIVVNPWTTNANYSTIYATKYDGNLVFFYTVKTGDVCVTFEDVANWNACSYASNGKWSVFCGEGYVSSPVECRIPLGNLNPGMIMYVMSSKGSTCAQGQKLQVVIVEKTSKPSFSPSRTPSAAPSRPTILPTRSPSRAPSKTPSKSPVTSKPSLNPVTSKPSTAPATSRPSKTPSKGPVTSKPSRRPSKAPVTSRPSNSPWTSRPSAIPTRSPSSVPTTAKPSNSPITTKPTFSPNTSKPSAAPVTLAPVLPTTLHPTAPAGPFQVTGSMIIAVIAGGAAGGSILLFAIFGLMFLRGKGSNQRVLGLVASPAERPNDTVNPVFEQRSINV